MPSGLGVLEAAGHRHRPGAFLSESVLARLHGTSRTPIREVLSRLGEEGYVERVPGRGYLAARVTMTSIRNTFQVRRLLEGQAAARAAVVADEGDIDRIRQAMALPFGEKGDDGRLANAELHLAIAAATHNALWLELVRRCLAHIDRFTFLLPTLQPIVAVGALEHDTIVSSIEEHDAEAARAAMERHLDETTTYLLEQAVRGQMRGLDL
jgi:DNA-binding GntR family transcriptional regulator